MGKTKSVLTDDMEHCVITGSPYVEIHHIFGGPNRKLSDRYGFVIPLRPDWHRSTGYSIHSDKGLDLQWKRTAQGYFEAHCGSRDEFRRVFGKSYL